MTTLNQRFTVLPRATKKKLLTQAAKRVAPMPKGVMVPRPAPTVTPPVAVPGVLVSSKAPSSFNGRPGRLARFIARAAAAYRNKKMTFSAPGIGGAIGGVLGGPLGAIAGRNAGRAFRQITGVGDYYEDQLGLPSQQIMNASTVGNTFVVRHREFIADIIEPANNSGAFTLRQFPINAGMPSTFPWLSQLADLFDQYRIRAMVFQYVPTSSMINNAASGGLGLGVVVAMTDYDSADAAPISKQQMEATQFCTSAVPFREMLHPIECKRSQTTLPILYVRSGAPPTGVDLRMYDLGITYVATSGVPNNTATQTLGELWVSYEIELLKPILNPTLAPSLSLPPLHIAQFNIANVSAPNNYFGNSPYPSGIDGTITSNNIPALTIIYPGTNTMAIRNNLTRPVSFFFSYSVKGASTALTNGLNLTVGSGISSYTALFAYTGSVQQAAGTTSITQYFQQPYTIAVSTAFVQITINSGTLPTSIAAAFITIFQVA